jgi:hypothetical protein
MRWEDEAIDAFRDHVTTSGLRACPVCDSSESMAISPAPAVIPRRGFSWVRDERAPGYDRQANVLEQIFVQQGARLVEE